MQKTVVAILVTLGLLYGALHAVVSSKPVQSRLLQEIQDAIATLGFELEIESIEVAAFSPKFYLNRVTIRSTERAEIQLPVPLTIDKIKVRFSPLGLLSKRLVINEAVMFNPKIIIPRADVLYRKVMKQLKSAKQVELEGGTLKVIVQKIGIVDALFNVISLDPAFAVNSRSLTVFVLVKSKERQNITVLTRELGIKRGPLDIVLNEVDVDVDLSPESVQVNHGIVRGEDLSIDLEGASSLPLVVRKRLGPKSWNASFDLKVPLPLLHQVPELGKLPDMTGNVSAKGAVKLEKRSYTGSGKVSYENLSFDGYAVEKGEVPFVLNNRNIDLRKLDLHYGGGRVMADEFSIVLKEPVTLQGDVQVEGLTLNGLLDNLKEPGIPLRGRFYGPAKVQGQLSPFKLDADIDVDFKKFRVIDEDKPNDLKEDIIQVDDSAFKGRLTFFNDRMEFQSAINILDGKAHTEGVLDFGAKAKIHVRGEGLSLTDLGKISDLRLAGRADILTEIEVLGGDTKVSGSFEVEDGEIANIVLGRLKGLAHFENALLSFENLVLPTNLDPAHGSGFVDFKKGTHYRFRVEAKRLGVDRLFNVFQRQELTFSVPKGGEVQASMSIEGGHDQAGIEVIAKGQGKDFEWYTENWTSGDFNLVYRPAFISLNDTVLNKRSGGLGVNARFADDNSKMTFESKGLRLEDLDYLGDAPLSGLVEGEITIEGDLGRPVASGMVAINNATFREVSVPESSVILRSQGQNVEIFGRLMGEKLRGRWTRNGTKSDPDKWEFLVYFDDYDFAPLIVMAMGKDIPILSEIRAKGDLSLSGSGQKWDSLSGAGTIQNINVGLKGTPMENSQPLAIKVDKGAFEVSKFHLVGRESEVTSALYYKPREKFEASFDGKLDLQYLQPFIPGLEFGTGKVAAGVRFSGAPPNFDMLGNVVLEDGTIRLTGLYDEMRAVQAQLSLSHDRINIDRFQGVVNGGNVQMQGDVRINQFSSLIPNLNISATRVGMRFQDYLRAKFTGDFQIKGDKQPYLLRGSCRILEGELTKFDQSASAPSEGDPSFNLDVKCGAPDRLFVKTDIMNAEFKGDFHIMGNTQDIGLLGSAEGLRGLLFFRNQEFSMETALVRFQSKTDINPRFNVTGSTRVEGQSDNEGVTQEYTVNLHVLGVPEDYKIRLTSSPSLSETEIISLLLFGRPRRGNQDKDYLNLGSALMGEIPLHSKIENELGLGFNISQRPDAGVGSTTTITPSAQADEETDPVAQVELVKEITDRTKLSYANTISATQERVIKIEHQLGDSITVNGMFQQRQEDASSGLTETFGIDFRYRFEFQ